MENSDWSIICLSTNYYSLYKVKTALITVGACGDSLDRGLVEVLADASLDAGCALFGQLVFLLHHLLHDLATLVVGRWLY
jgi:hypothetical protein